MSIPIMLDINDDIGNHKGKVSDVVIGDQANGDYIELELIDAPMLDNGMACRFIGDKKLRLGRRIFPILGYQSFVGNIYWECAHVTEKIAADILNYLRSRGDWSANESTEKFFNKWSFDQEIFTANDFKPEPKAA